jgi:hypothetical protein
MSIKEHRAAIANQIRLEARDSASQNPSPHCRPSLLLLEVNFNRASWQQPMGRFDEDAGRGHIDNRRIDTWPHEGRHDAVLLDRLPPPYVSAFEARSHSGDHRRDRQSKRKIRTLAVPPTNRTAYCVLPWPFKYSVPDEDVPSALKLTMLLAPNRIGSSPGGGLPASIAGSPGNAPKSTPLNWLDICSGE